MEEMMRRAAYVAMLILIGASVFPQGAAAQPLPKLTLGVDQAESPRDVAVTLEILFLLTVLSLAPSIILMMTSFTRIVIVFHFLRQALGLQQMPPNQLLIGLSLFMTFFIMHPVLKSVNDEALQPYLEEKIGGADAFDKAMSPLRDFMMRQTREKDLALFVKLAKSERPANPGDIPNHVLIPAFVISEIRMAFQIGFLIYIPFLMIDMVIASVLMSMGMLMLPPAMVSLPFKILLFVMVDGWYLLVGSIVEGFK
jgi:flagellar biosynthetic protein FliP